MPPKISKTPGSSQSLLRPVPAESSPGSGSGVESSSSKRNLDVSALKAELIQAVKDEIRNSLEEFRVSIRSEFHSLKTDMLRDIAALRSEFTDMKKNVSEIEHSLSSYSDDVVGLQAKVNFMATELRRLDQKCDDLESRSRRQNIRIVGVPESQPTSTTFVSTLLKDAFTLDKCPEIDRAHRSLAPTPKSGDPPRPVIVRMHYYKDCAEILKKARELQRISVSDMRISVYPDYTAKVAKARSAFNDVRKQLRALDNVRYSLLFPARLRISHGDTHRIFTSAEEAKLYVDSLPK